ncbi:hypothetical protein GGR21_000980 [Dysgonomonas hofstadii]|uniref:Outer membrane protein beta-barrel domain-containing protein n=1 Tax=Dysgonomonas hofstadii TaxID=637886 RepID=A0A840CIS8_9BACT|nr:hypothetical protein [Dysgonomonas hofstadii]MBB4035091.1 hypothetical protein [Dysgonomonas hofstadii]
MGQDSIPRTIYYPRFREGTKDISLYTGFVMSGEEKVSTRGFEVGLSKDYLVPPLLISYGYYGASEFLFNRDGFLMGPKAGCYASFFIAYIGNELVLYNDFKKSSLHYAPYFGIGVPGGRISIAYHLPFYNKDFRYKRNFTINIAVNIFNISKKKFYWHNLNK